MGMKLDAKAIFDKLSAQFGDAVSGFVAEGVKDPSCKVKAESIAPVVTFLRDDAELRFDFLQCVTGVDWPKQSLLQVVYHLYSYPHRHSFVLKVEVPRDNPLVPSIVSVYATADWQEREQYDLLGIQFTGHPELKRLLMPDDWVGHPMRKDFKEAGEYRGMQTTRYSPLELLAAYDKANPQQEGTRPMPKAGGKGKG
jgi:NADH-quinone oxidoreductase subunit C